MKTLIVAIIDESGSMANKLNDVIGGWNTFLETQKAVKDDEGTLILVKFNTAVSVVADGVPLADVKPFSATGGPDTIAYTPGGGTALFDAIAHSIRLADKLTFDRSVVVVITDGEENSSHETNLEQVKKIIQERTARGNWTFTYLGEQPEKWARDTGTSFGNVGGYNHHAPGQSFGQAAVSTAVLRSSPEVQSAAFYSGEGKAQQPAAESQAGAPSQVKDDTKDS